MNQADLKEVLHYNLEPGVFTWIVEVNKHKLKGRIAGSNSSDPDRYRKIKIRNKFYLAHRLAFLYVTGCLPVNFTDHINGDRHDNSWANLREVNSTDNMRNAKKPNTNRSGVVGLYWDKNINKWKVYIGSNGKQKYLCLTADFFEDVCRRKSAELEFGYHKNHGRTA